MFLTYDPVTDHERLLTLCGLSLPEGQHPVAGAGPTTAAVIVREDGQPPGALGQARLGQMAWPQPFGAEAGPAAEAGHCRIEAMKSHPAFRESWWAGRRCVVPVERIAAWCQAPSRPELLHVERRDGAPLALAGLWKAWSGPGGDTMTSFCLLTLPAEGHPVFGRLLAAGPAPRMPALLPAESLALWLQGSLKEAERLLQPCSAALLQALPQHAADAGWREPASWAAIPDMFPLEWHALAATAPREASRPTRTLRPRAPAAPGPTTADLF